jgi:hypothetical protein
MHLEQELLISGSRISSTATPRAPQIKSRWGHPIATPQKPY